MKLKELLTPKPEVPMEQKIAALQKMLSSLKALNARLPADLESHKKNG